jgi:uncharacterized protein YjbI with pentapeptide repeats
MTTLLTKKLLTEKDIINQLDQNCNEITFENALIINQCFSNRLCNVLFFKDVEFENVTFKTNFLHYIYFDRCTFKNCRTEDNVEFTYNLEEFDLEKVQAEGSATFKNCVFDNFTWALFQPMQNDFRKCLIINNSNFNLMNLVYGEFSKCRIEDSIFTPKLYFSQNGDEQKGGSIFENNTIINCDLVGIELASASCNEFINCKIEEFFAPPYFKNNSFTDIKSMRVYFNEARSTNFYINVSFEYSDFTNATLSGSLFKNCDLSSDTNYLINATFSLAYKDEIKLTDKQLATDVIFI